MNESEKRRDSRGDGGKKKGMKEEEMSGKDKEGARRSGSDRKRRGEAAVSSAALGDGSDHMG